MLGALANGLRVGGRFEIATAAFAEPSALLPLSEQADVVALFYGTRQFPLAQLVQSLAEPVRKRGARLVAVLQRDQASLRDGCFHAGASDLLFMPMPKDQFVSRLFETATLAFGDEAGQGAKVSVTRRGQPAETLEAQVNLVGVRAAQGPALAAGETVQLAWKIEAPPLEFARWGLVVQGGEGVKIRIAGANADEELQLRAWVKGEAVPGAPSRPGAPGASAPATQVNAVPPTLVEAPSFPPGSEGTSKPLSDNSPTLLDAKAVPPTVLDAKAVPPTVLDAKAVPPTVLDAPALAAPGGPQITPTSVAKVSASGNAPAGLPPGFAARPPIRPQSLRGVTGSAAGRPRSLDLTPTGEHKLPPTDPAIARGPSGPGAAPMTMPGVGTTNPGLPRASNPSLRPVPPRSTPPTVAALPAGAQAGDAPRTSDPKLAKVSAAGEAPRTSDPKLAKASSNGAAARTSDPALAKVAAASTPGSSASSASAPAAAAASPLVAAPAAPASSPGAAPAPGDSMPSGLESLFDDAPAAAGSGAAPAPEIALASWPGVYDPAVARALIDRFLREKQLPPDAPAGPAEAVRRVVGALPSADREALELAPPDSHLHEALVARVLLVEGTLDGLALSDKGEGALVDDAHLSALLQAADTAGKRCQSEADKAIAKGDLEPLQQVTVASANLSRDLLALKETADRLRGLASAPRLGAGALDPNVIAPQAGKQARRAQEKKEDEQRAEQRKQLIAEFSGLQDTPKAQKQRRWLVVLGAILLLGVINAIVFAPGFTLAPPTLVDQAGSGVLQLTLSEKSAIVAVAPTWLSAADRKPRLRQLCDVLLPHHVKKAVIFSEGKGIVGQVDVPECQGIGLPAPKPPPPELGGAPPPH